MVPVLLGACSGSALLFVSRQVCLVASVIWDSERPIRNVVASPGDLCVVALVCCTMFFVLVFGGFVCPGVFFFGQELVVTSGVASIFLRFNDVGGVFDRRRFHSGVFVFFLSRGFGSLLLCGSFGMAFSVSTSPGLSGWIFIILGSL